MRTLFGPPPAESTVNIYLEFHHTELFVYACGGYSRGVELQAKDERAMCRRSTDNDVLETQQNPRHCFVVDEQKLPGDSTAQLEPSFGCFEVEYEIVHACSETSARNIVTNVRNDPMIVPCRISRWAILAARMDGCRLAPSSQCLAACSGKLFPETLEPFLSFRQKRIPILHVGVGVLGRARFF